VVFIFFRKDVISHNKWPMTHRDKQRNECFDQSGLSRADGPADADSSGAGRATQIQIVIVPADVMMMATVIHLASSACEKAELCLLVAHGHHVQQRRATRNVLEVARRRSPGCFCNHRQCNAQNSLSNAVVGQAEADRRRNPVGRKSIEVGDDSLQSTHTELGAEHASDDCLVSGGFATLD
jgi:hypothetical protein